MQKKKIIVISAAVAAVLAAAAIWFFFFRSPSAPSDDSEIAYVTPIRNILSGGIGATTKLAGVVEPQKTLEVKKDETKKVAELYVTVGQEVSKGDKLFSYDMDDISMQLTEAELSLQSLNNRITTLNQQIESLAEERNNAPEDERFSYTLQIQSTQLEVRSAEYDQSVKSKEIEKLRASLQSTDVFAEDGGIVQSINDGTSYDPYGNETSNAYITILSTGEYRVKATVTELNIGALYQGMPMRVVSRVDQTKVWEGEIEEIDYEPVQNNNANYYVSYGTEDSFTQASKYNFYVKLDSIEGLMLGQHVYVEPDLGGGETREGLWLPGYYIFTEGSRSYVWAGTDRNTLAKREVTLGQYSDELDEFEILSGVTEKDSLAVPTDDLHEGMYAERSSTVVGGAPVGGEMMGGEMFEGGMVEGDMPEDGMTEGDAPAENEIIGGVTEDAPVDENGASA